MKILKIVLNYLPLVIMLNLALFFIIACSNSNVSDKTEVKIFYKERPPSMQTLEKVKDFIEEYQNEYNIQYFLITDEKNEDLLKSLGFLNEHFPFAIAINGKTSAGIDNEIIIFANFPDYMHHINRHQGNWTLKHLEQVLKDNTMLLDENPIIENIPGGKIKKEDL